jgi:hypothetical protein
MLSSRSLVVTPPAAENPPGLPPAASTRWHGTMIGNGFIRGVRLRSRHVHFLEQPAPDPTISLRQRRAANALCGLKPFARSATIAAFRGVGQRPHAWRMELSNAA